MIQSTVNPALDITKALKSSGDTSLTTLATLAAAQALQSDSTTQPVCPNCGGSMRRLKLIERIRIKASEEEVFGKATLRTHICKHEVFTYATAVWKHSDNE
jgi:ribosomal protein L32